MTFRDQGIGVRLLVALVWLACLLGIYQAFGWPFGVIATIASIGYLIETHRKHQRERWEAWQRRYEARRSRATWN